MATAQAQVSGGVSGGGWSWLWERHLTAYPEGGRRWFYLGVAVLSTIILYYELYAVGGVSTIVSEKLGMSFLFLLTMLGITNLIGAFGSLIAGIADRTGRGNLVVWGLLVVGLLTLFAVPNCGNKWGLAVILCVIGLIEGMLLVATPALVRDFSPQVGRAEAMGIWNVGPVAGSLIVSAVATGTLATFNESWTSQFRIAGIAGLVMFVIALIWLKELTPEIRDQLMVNDEDRELNAARAARGEVTTDISRPFRQLAHLDIIGPSIGFGVFLLLYFTLVGFGPVLYSTVFGFSASEANGIGSWAWGANVVVTLFLGLLIDWTKVRKPWIIAGCLATIAFEIYLLTRMGHHISFGELSLIMALMSASFAVAAVPFYAAFTETIEARNPALTATGLAIWGWIIRIVAFLSFIIEPIVITSTTPILENSGLLKAAQAAGKPPSPEVLKNLQIAVSNTYGQWQIWMWVCVGGAVVFMLLTPTLRGRWRRREALADLRRHEEERAAALAAIRAESA